ncbi:MAG: hypothetical protein FJX65_13775 [Alphaproteobacteria bacterium]|nr:hypothetical protein [Alphaproteobacteria bacterium]
MGLLLMHPMIWHGAMLGFIFVAAQQPRMCRPLDSKILAAFADVATVVWVAQGGVDHLADILAALPPAPPKP